MRAAQLRQSGHRPRRGVHRGAAGAGELRRRRPVFADGKVQLVEHGRRLSFAHLFDYATAPRRRGGGDRQRRHLFDETLALLDSVPLAGRLLCLSRWTSRKTDDAALRQSVQPGRLDLRSAAGAVHCDFCLGVPGCDNRLAFEAERAGLVVSNPSRSIRARHCTAARSAAIPSATACTVRTGWCRRLFLMSRAGCCASVVERLSVAPRSPRRRPRRRPATANSSPCWRPTSAASCRSACASSCAGRWRSESTARRYTRFAARRGSLPRVDGLHVGPAGARRVDAQQRRAAVGLVPPPLRGLCFTQVVANRAAPVDIAFRTAGASSSLAAPGWKATSGCRVPRRRRLARTERPLRTRDGTSFEAWSLVAGVGEHLVVPTQVMLVTEELVRLG